MVNGKKEGMIMNGKRDDEVGGDPVGSTDPEVSRHLHPCTNLGMQNALAHNSGRSAPGWCPFWAFNAHLLPISGVERQNHACSGRSAPG